ncbi:erythroid differentiation-related factor 1 isoform X1 [Nilaparvata lugens]|uniref:erythroid differentiation-related factor 1 isoform X1 n=1 Tax=Nilaparvata lugens TaxID=108931 RepID=UPI00193E6386|nr:erythroid differentiation-related factor 1 isoform X1 [Nilaparvata lugens]
MENSADGRISGGDRGSEQNREVKSTAIVKYSAIQPAKFAQLQCNTDLNLPPANWLSSSAESYGFQHVLSNSGAFSSFRMAHMFPDCMGQVDVVSDAENVKKLLKIPYSRGSVSMMVHRIENTLLIDEFDIHKHLIRQAESDWVWLRKFFFEHVLQSLGDKDKGVTLRNHSRCALQQKYLTSKFLHHSLAETSDKTQERLQNQDTVNRPTCSRNEPPLPEPPLEEEVPDPATNKTFARNVVWTFEDIQMLLGTDMPIFGGSTHPCISLRLRDMTKPISVLTGIDYWLDNLMCNVPEVMMCYHLDGIVQRYELIKTEDLPHLSGSKFSPKLIRDVAQNILSFLKVNATKAGHTYWLFKSRDDDVVKLYDLTSLCSEGLIDKGQNPFTIPVAMLLYRVARNMKHNLPNSQPGTVRMLLKNCLSLLPKEKYPQIVTSAHYMLSDLYVPVTTDPASPGLSDENNDDEEEQERRKFEEEEFENEATVCATTNSVAVQSLCVSNAATKVVDPPAPPMVGTIEDRCQMALQHVAAGLECLKYFEESSPKRGKTQPSGDRVGNERQQQKATEEEVKYAHPFQAIPMPYAPISTEKKKGKKQRKGEMLKKEDKSEEKEDIEEMSLRALLCRPHAETLPTWQQPEGVDNAFWNTHLKTLLYEKVFLVYVTLAEQEYNCGNYGVALRYIHCVLRYMSNFLGKNSALTSYLLGRAGDCCLLLAKNWSDIERHFTGYTTKSDIDVEIEEAICKKCSPTIDDNEECKLMPKVMDNVGQMLVVGCQFYSRALALAPCDNLRRRLGNIHNEIGSYYMNQAATVQSTPPTNNEERLKYDNLFKAARSHLEQGVEQFESVSDNANLALLHSNTGRLMRLLAHYQQHCHQFDGEEDEDKIAVRVSKGEKYYYNRAFSSYQKALGFLGARKSNPLIWDTINWELSSALFAYATMMQDYPPPITNRTREEIEREVVDLMQKALKYCDVDTAGPRQPMYQYRAGMLHYRLACMYHKIYRNLVADENSSRRKNVLQLCTLNYEKAARILLAIEYPSDYLRVQLERVALLEFQSENSNGALMKIKHYQNAIAILVQCIEILNIMKTSANTPSTISEESDVEQQERTTEKNLLDLMENRLQFLLRSLVKLCITNPQLKLSESETVYKSSYNTLLKRKDQVSLVEHLINVLNSLSALVVGM